MNGTTEHKIWLGMRSRCLSPTAAKYHLYGGRGITICKRWGEFSNFFADMGFRPSKRHSLDRIDNDGPYSPENCRWATQSEQCRNQKRNHLVTYMGVTAPVIWWAEQIGLGKSVLGRRLHEGMPIGRALLPKHFRWGHWLSKEKTDWSQFQIPTASDLPGV